jgi:hypothetical protein
MTVVAMALSRVTSFVAAPIAVGSYVISLWAIGGLGGQQVGLLREALSRKVGRNR